MSSRSKGHSNERIAKKALEEMGYAVYKASPLMFRKEGRVFMKSWDVFGMFDLIAAKKGNPVLMVQVCSTEPAASERRKKIDLWIGDVASS